MACQGPDLDGARDFGKKVADALLEELIKEYKLADPTNPKYKVISLGNSKNRWKKARGMFVKSVQELFVENACNSF
jgi:hypothetical protein